MDAETRERRERFVHGHTGGSFAEVIALTAIIETSHILFSSFLFAFDDGHVSSKHRANQRKEEEEEEEDQSKKNEPSAPPPLLLPPLRSTSSNSVAIIRTIVDFALTITPFLLAITALHEHVYAILVTQISLITLNFAIFMTKSRISFRFPTAAELRAIPIRYNHEIDSKNRTKNGATRFSYVSNLLSALLLATSIAILAVDFPGFDRRFAKTEMYGWSLMDVGVGGFIAINGVLSPESRFFADPGTLGTKTLTRTGLIKRSIRSAAPLLTLAFIRLALVTGLNYQQHVSEYGVHWNFFFTIAFTKLFAALICSLLSPRVNLALLAMLGAIITQYCLTFAGVTDTILHRSSPSDRAQSLFAANREGAISTIGSVWLYLVFVEFGRKYMPKRKNLFDFGVMLAQIAAIIAITLSLMLITHHTIEPVSRRETNFAFICFIIAFVSTLVFNELSYFAFLQLLSARLSEAATASRRSSSSSPDSLSKICDPLDLRYRSPLFESLGRAGLATFLVANLLTGAVNLSIDTISLESIPATLAILFAYSATLTAVCRLLCATIYANR